ncbi:hypothetical protein LOTGIDRAFT_138075 [Lottia gigantea]|uniref:GST C-terminal domain-containing protein n=1 Tax=Lottia gigantea TaxID=225164 RepID=V4BA27_LOTGI|nr:hypothetical protein LOTGIDRAFT_138075 [Lottia gigantea]ESP02617.1 hypothetical protein LOTGIDRAFT_138075 [Lottia gigantea]
MKVETYLRINNIPYVADPGVEMGPKGKVPWIEYNGEVFTDSSFILKWCNKTFSVDLDKKLSPKEQGVARSIQKLVEEDIFWCCMMCLFVLDYTDNSWTGFGWLPNKIINYKARKDCWAQGIGRHTKEEVLDIMESDVKALSNILGNQKFIMGNDVSEVDCCVFGFLCQLIWQSPEQPCVDWMKVKYPNLKGYCERMKTAYWKDWDECITHGLTKEATK